MSEAEKRKADAQLHLWRRAEEITQFCAQHGGKCFAGWPVKTVFAYVFFHLVDHGLFIVRANGNISALMFAWGTSVPAIFKRHQEGVAPFAWQRSHNDGDAIFLAEVVGDRSRLPKLFKAAVAKWPDWQRKRIFTYRNGNLVDLPHELIKRMIYGALAGRPQRRDIVPAQASAGAAPALTA